MPVCMMPSKGIMNMHTFALPDSPVWYVLLFSSCYWGPESFSDLCGGTRLVSSGAMVQTKAGWLLPSTSWTGDSDKQRGPISWDCLCAGLVLINKAPDYVLTPPTCHPPLFFVRVQSVKGIKGKQSDSILIPSNVETLFLIEILFMGWCLYQLCWNELL